MVEPLMPHNIPELRYEKVGYDILDFGSKNFLVLIDYLSHWIELRPIVNKSSLSIIDQWQEVFVHLGYPKTIIADNNPFSPFHCKSYCLRKGINLVTSTPHYPKSNSGESSRNL